MASTNNDSAHRERSESTLTEKATSQEPGTQQGADSSAVASDATNPPDVRETSKPLPTIPDRLRSITDATLRFLGDASNETLGACAVGLAASTYLVLGRLGLVLIGAFGGVVLGATWDQTQSLGDSDTSHPAQRKKELGAEIVKRNLDWRNKKREEDGHPQPEDKVEASASTKQLDFSRYPPDTAAALTAFSDAVIKDYVKYWYAPILPADNAFPADCRHILVAFIQSLSNQVSRKRAADPFLDFVANSTSVVIVFLQELAVALKASQRSEVEEALNTYLTFQPDSNLANVLNKDQQKQKLHLVADDILQNFLDSKTYNCLPARTFLREVLAGLILDGTLLSCSKPEWINGWIVYLLEDGEPAILDAIDAGVSDLEEKAKQTGSPVQDVAQKVQHKRRMSRAEQAMEDAVREAQRMNELIAQDEASRKQELSVTETEDALSTTATTDTGIETPTSSDSEPQPSGARSRAESNAMVFDSEGNTIPSVTASPAKQPQSHGIFTSFDQLEQVQAPTVLQPTTEAPARTETMVAIPLTLHNASITIMDMAITNDQVLMRQKPDEDMLVQIEPASNRFPGWMVTRQYAAFEQLFDTVRRIAHISGVAEFNLQYQELPSWKGRRRTAVIADLERYLKAALKSDRLAESEAMKRFLEKETGLDKIPASQKNVFVQAGAGLENVGKGFVNVLGQGGKGLQTGFQTGGKVFQTGGKAVLGGVTGVFGAVTSGIPGPKRPGLSSNNSATSITRSQQQLSSTPRQSQDMLRQSTDLDYQVRGSPQPPTSTRSSTDQLRASKEYSMTSSQDLEDTMNLPPRPDMITEEYERTKFSPQRRAPAVSGVVEQSRTPSSSHKAPSTASTPSQPSSSTEPEIKPPPKSKARPQDVPVSEEETRMTVELMFALITELLSLSSAWTFRLSLLTAAKSYLLRPRNPQLVSIQQLLQESIIDGNLSDAGIAAHIRKLRENALPTEEELSKWPKEPTPDEKERLRIKARKLLVERGMPQALTTVVGVAASGEALGKVFDCLQNVEVARGLIFALLLQALRTVIQ
ncbi:hypothetical protein LTR70_001477 [Exophiala xenobiotica]|uniref:PXA domain-containing protein n=1 Tax=Lithohypha guttulata TaxID=1690604 RepID=A0ABR0KGW7_9EURO|nr:hypothetical protein LTR24_002767 [Lithohypha guttulata]KAK5327854.1 hypothetical protein LTR70_001477 [Exophiala xenobiotica]